MARRQGGEVVRLEKPWGEVFTAQEAAEFDQREKPQVVMYVQAETSAGAYQRGDHICKAAHDVGALVIAKDVRVAADQLFRNGARAVVKREAARTTTIL